MKANFRFISIALSLVLCFAGMAFGQETTGNIEGYITDTADAVVPSVTITITGVDRGFNRTTTTDDEGFYRLQQVPSGTYKISTDATNFAAQTSQEVRVTLGNTTKVDFKLQAAGSTATVDVVAQGEVLDPTGSKVQTSITGRELELLPKGTNFASVLKAAAPVRQEPSAAGFQIDGASGSENTFIIDGQEVTNFRTGSLNSNNNISLEFVQEVQVKTSGFEAEYGGATGGVINVVTRGGGNDFHGSASFQLEAAKLQAGPRSFNFGDPEVLTYFRPDRDGGTNFYPSFQVNGPIVKDKVWFLANYAPQYFDTQRRFTFDDNTTREYTVDAVQEYGFVRLDAAPVNNLTLTGSFTWNPYDQDGTLPGFGNLFSGDQADEEEYRNLGGRIPANVLSTSATYIVNKNLFFSARYGRSYLNEKLAAYGTPAVTRVRCLGTGNPLCPFGAENVANNFQTLFDISIRNTFDGDVSFTLPNFLGNHQFKTGVQINDVKNTVDEGYIDLGEVRLFYGSRSTDRNGVQFGSGIGGAIGIGYLQTFGTRGEAGSRNTAVYIQDKWQPFNGLTLNLGVRAERENVPTFAEGGQSIEFNFGDKIAPRLGFAYDIGGNGKFKIFASYGRFYDRFKYELPRGSFGGDIFLRDYFAITNPDPNVYTRAFALNPANNRNTLDFRVPSNDPDDLRVDPDLRAQQQTEYTGGIQYQFRQNMVLGARYIHKQIDHAIEDIGYHIGVTIPGTTQSAGSEAYVIGNPGEGQCRIVACGRYGGLFGGAFNSIEIPKAKREYDALEVTLNKRFSNSFSFDSSYTYSRLFGNYPGLASSDEFIVNGAARNSPNVNRLFDQPFVGYSVGGVRDDGRLPTDRPHVFKFSGAYSLNWSDLFDGTDNSNTTNFSTFFIAQSGTPLTTRVDLLDVTTIPLFERGNLGRTPTYTQTDFFVSHSYKFGRDNRYSVVAELNLLNAFNQATVLARQELISVLYNGTPAQFGIAATPGVDTTGRIAFDRAFFNGTTVTRDKVLAAITAAGASDVNYNQPILFQGPRAVRFGFRFIF